MKEVKYNVAIQTLELGLDGKTNLMFNDAL